MKASASMPLPAAESDMLTAAQVAKILGVSLGFVYSLAAPVGPLACYRYGVRCIRFAREDLEAYRLSITCNPHPARPAPDLSGGGISSQELRRRFAAMGYNVSIKAPQRKKR